MHLWLFLQSGIPNIVQGKTMSCFSFLYTSWAPLVLLLRSNLGCESENSWHTWVSLNVFDTPVWFYSSSSPLELPESPYLRITSRPMMEAVALLQTIVTAWREGERWGAAKVSTGSWIAGIKLIGATIIMVVSSRTLYSSLRGSEAILIRSFAGSHSALDLRAADQGSFRTYSYLWLLYYHD